MKKILLLSLIITLPINILGGVWLYKTHVTYQQLDKFSFTMPKGSRLLDTGIYEFNHLIYKLYSLIGINAKTDVALYVQKKKYNKLISNLPLSGNDYKKDAILITDNQALKGKVKLRGDHFYHWSFPNKSWRFKTSKNQIYKGLNKINLINNKSPNLLINHLSYKLAKRLNVLAPSSSVVDFSLNGVYNGTRLMVGQIDESFLRNNKRMPNDIYKGDNIGQSTYVGVNVLLFENPSIWQKASYNNHYAKDNIKPLKEMIAAIQQGQYGIYDLKSFASMAAYIDIAGTYHHDRTHNWMLYYDNYLEKMFPIVWDSLGFVYYTINLENYNIATSELWISLYENYDFLRLKHELIKQFFSGQDALFLQDLQQAAQVARKKLKNIPYSFANNKSKIAHQKPLASVDLLVENIKKRVQRVKHYFLGNETQNYFHYATLANGIRLAIAGNKPLLKIIIKGKDFNKQQTAELSYWQNNQKVHLDISRNLKVKPNNLEITLNLMANIKQADSFKHTVKYKFAPATYDFTFAQGEVEKIESISLILDNDKQQVIKVIKQPHIDKLSFNPKLKNIVPIQPPSKTITWQGEKTFSGLQTIKNDILIKKGTILNFAENATLKVLGKVTAIGTKDAPIIFQAQDSTKPWGAFALKDAKANGSVFKHVIFKGGSGNKGELHEYTAMFSVHNVKNLLLDACEFYDSKITDDMMHVIYSDVKIKNSLFIRSKSDALDVDISNVVVENSQFIDSGNDAIDLMTTNALVINTTFSHSADKGISIGEGSNLLAINNLIVDSEIGMQSKDTSLAYIYNTSFIDNKKAIDAYHKNWRYAQGGRIYVDQSVFKNNGHNATVGKKSHVTLNACEIDTQENFVKKDLRKKKIILSNEPSFPYQFSDSFFANKENLIHHQQQGYHE